MLFDKSTVIKLVEADLSKADRKNTPRIELMMGACLDDMSMRLKSIAMVDDVTYTVASGSRTYTITGNNFDVDYIWHIKYGTGNLQKPLIYKAPEEFIRKYDNPSASAAMPTYYTIMASSNGSPIIKFNCPTMASDTLIVWYYVDPSPDNIQRMRTASAIAQGTLAYWYGVSTQRGAVLYANFVQLVELARASDNFRSEPVKMFAKSKGHEAAKGVFDIMSGRRY